MLALSLKALHVLGAVLFLGVGGGSAFFKWRADRSGDLRVIAWAQREIVLADWLFTVPSALIMPITGLWLASLYGMRWTQGYVGFGLLGYAVAGGCWLPAAWLQIRMRRLAEEALRTGTGLPEAFHRMNRIWLGLGVPAFVAALATVAVMVFKGALV